MFLQLSTLADSNLARSPLGATVDLLAKPVRDDSASVPFLHHLDVKQRDCLSEAFTSVTLLKEARLPSGTWVVITNPASRRTRTVRLMGVADPPAPRHASGPVAPSRVLVSPSLLFNLHANPGDAITVARADYVFRSRTRLSETTPPVASRVTIARVRSPSSSGYAEYGRALRQFFSVPRVLAVGDILSVPVSCVMQTANTDDESHEGESATEDTEDVVVGSDFDLDGFALPTPTLVVHFSVTDIQCDNIQLGVDRSTASFLFDGAGGRTVLAQVGAVNAHVPEPDTVSDFLAAEGKIVKNAAEGQSPVPLVSGRLSLTDFVQTEHGAGGTPPLRADVLEALEDLALPLVHSDCAAVESQTAVILHGAKGTGKRLVVKAIAARLGVHVKEVSLTSLRGLPDDRASKKLQAIFAEAIQVGPCILLLRQLNSLAPMAHGSMAPENPDQVVRALTAGIRQCCGHRAAPVIVVASCAVLEDVPGPLKSCFSHDINTQVPDLEERFQILNFLAQREPGDEVASEDQTPKRLSRSPTNNDGLRFDAGVSFRTLATKTAGRTAVELKSLLANAGCEALNRLAKAETPGPSAITMPDIEVALDALPTAAMDIGAPKIPQVLWDDVGGLGHAKEEIMDMVELPLKHPELFATGVRQRSGILLYGPPGTGKTLLAKAVATECAMNFISVKGPELLDMYIGESERKVRQVFETARNASPCVLFFDELDSLAPQRGRGSDSGGVMDRVVSQLLTELDGMQGNANVFVIGATNRPDLLDQSLLRPGRFDRLIYLGICTDREAQLKIVQALSRKFHLSPEVDLNQVLESCPLTFTGADFYALCSGAMANALKRRVSELQVFIAKENEKNAHLDVPKLTPRRLLGSLTEEELTIFVKMTDYMEALRTTIPSVSADELRHYESLRDKFSSLAEKSDAGIPDAEMNGHAEMPTKSHAMEAKNVMEDDDLPESVSTVDWNRRLST